MAKITTIVNSENEICYPRTLLVNVIGLPARLNNLEKATGVIVDGAFLDMVLSGTNTFIKSSNTHINSADTHVNSSNTYINGQDTYLNAKKVHLGNGATERLEEIGKYIIRHAEMAINESARVIDVTGDERIVLISPELLIGNAEDKIILTGKENTINGPTTFTGIVTMAGQITLNGVSTFHKKAKFVRGIESGPIRVETGQGITIGEYGMRPFVINIGGTSFDGQSDTEYALIIGANNADYGSYKNILGVGNVCNHNYSVVFGTLNQALADGQFIFGSNNESKGIWASAFGVNNKSKGNTSVAMGHDNIASGEHGQLVVGTHNEEDSEAGFIVGDGWVDEQGVEHKQNAFKVNRGGSITIGKTTITENQLKQLLALLPSE